MSKLSDKGIAQAIYLVAKNKKGAELKDALLGAVSFLYRRRLFSRVPQILLHLQKIIDNTEGRVRGKIKSVGRLNEDTRRHLNHFLKKRHRAKEVALTPELDEKLLGGVRIEVADEVIDLTIKNKLNELQAYLTSSI